MALKKSQLYSSLWQSCDELRGGMDASQYKDYVLTLLFMKYVSDRHAADPNALIEVPPGGGFANMVALRGDKEIGDKINKIIGKLAESNDLKGVIDQADFNDESKLGSGKEMQDRLSKLVAIFDGLDFRANRGGGDDLLGDAYEYLMMHFATESGKSKGQFYTPAEVSRIMAKVIGIGPDTRQDRTIYDPTCGSGSLLLKAADEAPSGITIYGQEMDNATWALARMNLILHGHPTAELWRGNTLASPYFKNPDDSLKTFDFAVANPPFSAKAWTSGVNPEHDEYGRFVYGIPPAKNGDYAFLLHLIASLKSNGKGAIILPHGVLFRGNKEADIRKNLVRHGFIKGIIGLPANLFYGTGIPACILVIDKENAHARTGVFMIDASKGFLKDGNKNRLRAQDIHRIVDVFNKQVETPRYSRMVPVAEIGNPSNDYNLNIPRYIDSSDPEDLHDIDAHLNGGIPDRDLDALGAYWEVFPSLRRTLFVANGRPGYSDARIGTQQVKASILEHREFKLFEERVAALLNDWCNAHRSTLVNIGPGTNPKDIVRILADDLLACFGDIPLIDARDVYQRMMDYWDEAMQDDVYLIASDGWKAGRTLRSPEDNESPEFTIKKGKTTSKYVGEVIPSPLVIARFFSSEYRQIAQLDAEVTRLAERKEEFEEEHASDEGALNGLEGKSVITKGNVQLRVVELKEAVLKAYPAGSREHEQAKSITKTKFGTNDWIKNVGDNEGLFPELDILYDYLLLMMQETNEKTAHKQMMELMYESVIAKYNQLTEEEIKTLVIEDKWFARIRSDIHEEVLRITQQLTGRVKQLDERYARPLPKLEREVDEYSAKVEGHLKRMGLSL
ncbi:MAG: type I restriction-modification system subunit M [Gemmatimonadota bacterium]|nr:type I restriction-modification system subunit M [Gemmatimonadota bacterium]